MSTFLDYFQRSIIEPYFDKNGDPCVFAYDVGSCYWNNFTGENFHEPGNKEDIKAWRKIFNTNFWCLPGDLNFPAGIPIPEDLKEIHRCLVSFINSHVWFCDKKVSIVLANWIILSYFRDKFDFIPLIIINGATDSGKSTLGRVLMAACYRGFIFANSTASTIVQMINEFHTSIFLDKTLGALSKKDRTNILSVIESTTTKFIPYARRSPSHNKFLYDVNVYNIKTSVAISIKGREIPEDIVNRGVHIQMFPQPNNVELESNIDENEPIDGSYSLREIRAKLTALKISMEIRDIAFRHACTNWSNLISEQIEKVHKMLTIKAENGELRYGIAYGLENAPRIVGSQRDIVKAMLSIAMLTETERDTMEFILNSNAKTEESNYNSFEGEVLRGFVDVLQDHIDNAPLFSRSTPTDIIRKITTREIAQKINIGTRKVTNTLKFLGITYTVGLGAGDGKSTINPTTPGFFEQLEALVRRYDPNNIDVLEKLKEMNKK